MSNNGSEFWIDQLTVEKVVLSGLRADAAALEGGVDLFVDDLPWARLYPLAHANAVQEAGGVLTIEMQLPYRVGEGFDRPRLRLEMAQTGEPIGHSASRPLPRKRKARALVLIPAGHRYDHDKVRMHDWPVSQIIDTYSNIGDLMVYDSTLKLLDFEDIEVANIVDFKDADVDRYNSEFDFAFLRGSNFIHEYMDWARAGELIERLQIPVFAIGVGAQAETRRPIDLPPEGQRVWAAIADKCGSIGVRGIYSAEVLAHNGIKNVEVVGCPSLFRRRDRNLVLDLKHQADIRRIAFSLRRETGGNYCRDLETYLTLQRAFMLRLDQESHMTVTLHGEREEKAYFFRDHDRELQVRETLFEEDWFQEANIFQMEDIYRNRMFFNTTVAQYDDFIVTQDFAIGYRVHGILPALANGIPGMLVDYDERSAELAETLNIPLIPESALKDASWRDFYTRDAWSRFMRGFTEKYDTMRNYLTKNGVPHRL
ncbi:hypothetical protein ABAC460_14005 [Asticcacaulis sp. AC460]|uniref:polysaccharide pyruvyl transferase family protein n=1 Tax=Asticcacaulis sp. AC460 TaxID=1282360 RepID=UPI0003C3B486|nr:polysaccharide pyruvyl transferase family protein [Asticcacaulis sp. AC460]ESQ88890.1 hypothetical protein ABAC460_14005 [Asticcacaulis sp. AC460]